MCMQAAMFHAYDTISTEISCTGPYLHLSQPCQVLANLNSSALCFETYPAVGSKYRILYDTALFL